MPLTEWIGWTAATIAVLGVVLNNRLDRRCFLLWLVSNGLSAGLHVAAGMWALSVRDAIFFGLAVVGWWKWKRTADKVAIAHQLKSYCQFKAAMLEALRDPPKQSDK